MTTRPLLFAAVLLVGCTPTENRQAPDAQTPDAQTPDAGVILPECTPSAMSADLRINEFMAKNAVTIHDAEDLAADWLEIYNMSGSDVSLCGWKLRTKGETEASYEFVDLNVPAMGHTLIWLVGSRPITLAEQAPLKMRAEGGEIALLSPTGVETDKIAFGPQVADFSAARISDGNELWGLAWHPSPGAANIDLGLDGVFQETVPNQIPSTEGLTDLVLGYDEFPQIAIRIEAADVDSLRTDYRTYVPAYLTFKGREYGPVGLRLKGKNSFEPIDDKPSLRINIDEFVSPAKFFGLDDMTLNNMHSDFSMMHERLGYRIARELMVPASRSNHTLVTLNGEPYGLYANVETVKRHFLEGWFADSTGPLYEVDKRDFIPTDIASFEHETGPDDRTLLMQLAVALQNPDAAQAIADASEFVDMDAFARFWAMCAVIGQFDSFPYGGPPDDAFVYADPTSNKLHFIPWGMDETFQSGQLDVFEAPEDGFRSVLADTCLAVPSCKQKIVDQIWAALDIVEAFDWASERIRIIDEMSPYMLADDNKDYDNAEVTEFQTNLYWFIKNREFNLSNMLPPKSP